MTYIGIDFSVNFPSVCISEDFKKFKWISCVNGNITKKFKKILNDSTSDSLDFNYIDSKQKKTDQYFLTERNKLRNQLDSVITLISKIKTKIKPGPIVIGIEGYSYGSAGNSLVDIAQSTGILKSLIYKELTNNSVETIYVFSPGELKNAIGEKGNCGKIEIFHAFINNPIIEEVKETDLYKFVLNNKDDIFNGKEVKSPISDMIDSFLPILKFQQILK